MKRVPFPLVRILLGSGRNSFLHEENFMFQALKHKFQGLKHKLQALKHKFQALKHKFQALKQKK